MQPYLVYGLTSTLGAMGELAGHERRGALGWPARSALLGMMGAALGIRREGDFTALDDLFLAVAVFEEGAPLRDYHTVETVPTTAIKKPNSRPEALRYANGGTNTTITLRDYRVGSFYGIAVWGGALGELAKALSQPQFTLYFGRKSCPLAAPLGAKVVSEKTPEAALEKLILPPWHQGAQAKIIIETAELGDEIHDLPVDRRHWHYGSRKVMRRAVSIAPKGTV